ncbi:hypothetical protein [Actinomadura bangladeshensis]|uniref:Uncharacterized protein n=1 Tax=Actinomadura bangladeshensis TaxID=453573 RepID=A0A4R4NT85_9ACTN|nr:hypothetical protein [Actinomadura bangladeshensis]TDC12194.1 hypothetical protein E1284_24725 [Actinomadura bangladeshensis]
MTTFGSGSSPFERLAASMRSSGQPQVAKNLNVFGGQIAKAMQPRMSGAFSSSVASGNSSFRCGISPITPRPLLTGATPEAFTKLNGLGAQIAKAMLPYMSGTLSRGFTFPRGLTLARHTFFPEDHLPRFADVLQSLAEESRRRLAGVEPVARWLDSDAEARPGRWADPSPMIAVAVSVLRLLGVAKSPAENDEAGTRLPAPPFRAMLAIPAQEQAELDGQVDLSTAMVEESLARLWRLMTDIVAEFLAMIVVVFVVRVLARARAVVPRVWDAVLFTLVVLVACRRSGAHSDDSPHLSSLLIRRHRPSAGRVPAVC